MKTQDGTGSIINISSGAGHPAGSPTLVSYGAAKSGLNHLTRLWPRNGVRRRGSTAWPSDPTMTDNFRSFVLPEDDPP